jgi:hypothetical protein
LVQQVFDILVEDVDCCPVLLHDLFDFVEVEVGLGRGILLGKFAM